MDATSGRGARAWVQPAYSWGACSLVRGVCAAGARREARVGLAWPGRLRERCPSWRGRESTAIAPLGLGLLVAGAHPEYRPERRLPPRGNHAVSWDDTKQHAWAPGQPLRAADAWQTQGGVQRHAQARREQMCSCRRRGAPKQKTRAGEIGPLVAKKRRFVRKLAAQSSTTREEAQVEGACFPYDGGLRPRERTNRPVLSTRRPFPPALDKKASSDSNRAGPCGRLTWRFRGDVARAMQTFARPLRNQKPKRIVLSRSRAEMCAVLWNGPLAQLARAGDS